MRQLKIFFAFLIVLYLLPLSAFAASGEEYCFVDNFGDSYHLRGGKAGKKTFVVSMVTPNPLCGTLSGIATMAQLQGGGFGISILVTRDSAPVCTNVIFNVTAPSSLLSATGNYDNIPRNVTPDGSVTFTRVACATVAPISALASPNGPAQAQQ